MKKTIHLISLLFFLIGISSIQIQAQSFGPDQTHNIDSQRGTKAPPINDDGPGDI